MEDLLSMAATSTGVSLAAATGSEPDHEVHWRESCARNYHTVATFAIILFFVVSLPGNTFVVWIYGHQVTKTSYAFYVLVIATIDLLFTVVVVPCTLFLRLSDYIPFHNMIMQEVFYHSPKDLCQIFTVFLLIFIAEERIKIFSNPFRPITKARSGLIRIALVLLLAMTLFIPPVILAYYKKTGYLKLFTKLLQPVVLIIAALVLFCLNLIVVKHATRSKSERNELQKDIRAARSRSMERSRIKASSSNGVELDTMHEKQALTQSKRTLSNLEEDAKMVIALIVTSLVTCGFCMVKMQLIIELFLNKSHLIIVHGCWSHFMVQDFLPHLLAYLNYAMSPIVYYVISKRFREDVSRLVRSWRDCNRGEPTIKVTTVGNTDSSTRSGRISNSFATALSTV